MNKSESIDLNTVYDFLFAPGDGVTGTGTGTDAGEAEPADDVGRLDQVGGAFARLAGRANRELGAGWSERTALQAWQEFVWDHYGPTDVRIEIASPVCRVCGCTEDRACPGGCGWANPTARDLCTSCAPAATAAVAATGKVAEVMSP